MHLLLTDVLTCPHCGPDLGLIVLADRIEERVVREGRLGCANCRREYPIHDGVADLRLGDPSESFAPVGFSEERAFRTAALLGVGQGGGRILIVGAAPELVAEVDRLLPNALVVGGSTAAPPEGGKGWLLHHGDLPFRSGSLSGVALLDGAEPGLVRDAARALAPGARVVVDPAPAGATELVGESGLSILLEESGVMVASAPRPR